MTDPLRAALRPWLRHKDWCNVKTDDPPETARCKCGLAAALAADTAMTRATAKGTTIDVDEWDRPLYVAADTARPGHVPYCNRTDSHERLDCELHWMEAGESFVAYIGDVEALAARLTEDRP